MNTTWTYTEDNRALLLQQVEALKNGNVCQGLSDKYIEHLKADINGADSLVHCIVTMRNDNEGPCGFAVICETDEHKKSSKGSWFVELACSNRNAFELIDIIHDEALRLENKQIIFPSMNGLMTHFRNYTSEHNQLLKAESLIKLPSSMTCNETSCEGVYLVLNTETKTQNLINTRISKSSSIW